MVDFQAELAGNPAGINALKVVHRLQEHGYQAFLVGGCVRDLILGQSPKDYDVATDAHPDDVRDLFRNSRSIGRRFKIVHVRFGREVIEVATFRAAPPEVADTTASGMILSDNIYGSLSEDVVRRDFTMNALYYDPEHQAVSDQVGGQKDIEARLIRLIGKPENRFREDPVRMLRAVRFRAKLGFDVDPDAAKAIRDLGYLLQDIPAARLFEEVLKLFLSGHALASCQALQEFDLMGWLIPAANQQADQPLSDRLIELALSSTDNRIAIDKPVTPAFLYAAFMWWAFVHQRNELQEGGQSLLEASQEAAAMVIAKQQLVTSIPRRFTGTIRDIWQLQARLPNIRGKKPEILMTHKRFRAAYDFLVLREQSGESLGGLSDWWTEYQEKNPSERQQMSDTGGPGQNGGRRRRPRRRKPKRPQPLADDSS